MSKRSRHNYISDYGGPLVQWPGDNFEPDWAALFPIPKCYQKKKETRPKKRARRSTQQQQRQQAAAAAAESKSDSEDDYDGDFWISPRMAAQLHHAGCLYVDIELGKEEFSGLEWWDDLPAICKPYAKQKGWKAAYRQAAMRIVGRLEKGLLRKPNCTGEEMALHRIIEYAKEAWTDDEGVIAEMIEPLPESTTYDHDWDWVGDGAVQDCDVLMLYDMPLLADRSNAVAAFMGAANLHPEDWFILFKPDRVDDHVR